MDKIIIKGLEVFGYHGVNAEEKVDGQVFIVDVVLEVDLSKPCETDDVNDTVSYAKVIKTISKVMTEKSYNLIEKAALRIVDQVFLEYEPVKSIKLCLKKPNAPMKAKFDYVAVEIKRDRTDVL